MSSSAESAGRILRRSEVSRPSGYAVVDVETTGTTDSATDEIVSLAVLRLDADGVEIRRHSTFVRPSQPIPAEATCFFAY